MSAFLAITAKAFRRQLAYRAAFWTELAINLVFMVLYVYLWLALSPGVVSYIIVAQTVMTVEFTLRAWRELETKVRSGAIAIDLLRPMDFQAAALATSAGPALHTVLFNMLPKLALFYAAGVLAAPPSVEAAAIFGLSLGLSFLVQFGIELLIGLSAFWLIEIRGLQMFVMWGLAALFSGYFAPLELYPDWLAAIGRVLPFQAVVYTPAAAWGGTAGVGALAVQAAWAAGLALAGRTMLAFARRRLVVQGG